MDPDRLDIILGTTSALISSIGSRELFQVIADNAKEISGAKFVSLSFLDEERGTVKLGARINPAVGEAWATGSPPPKRITATIDPVA